MASVYNQSLELLYPKFQPRYGDIRSPAMYYLKRMFGEAEKSVLPQEMFASFLIENFTATSV